jgi:AcrR family transcriptional regulator
MSPVVVAQLSLDNTSSDKLNEYSINLFWTSVAAMRTSQKGQIRKAEILEHYYQVIIREGIEGASIGKIADHMHIHPSLIIHYFKTKDQMTVELVDLLIEKFETPHMLRFDHIRDANQRFKLLFDTIFSQDWSRTVDPSVFYAFYYLSFRNQRIQQRFEAMFRRFRDYVLQELTVFREEGLVQAADLKQAADIIVTLMEGLEFHAGFLADGQHFDRFAAAARQVVVAMLKGEAVPDTVSGRER